MATRVTSSWSRASSPALALLPSKSEIPQPVPSRGKVAEAGTAREHGCEIGEGTAGWFELAPAASSSSLFLRKEALVAAAAFGAGTHPSLTLAEICCLGVLPSRKQFPCSVGTAGALEDEGLPGSAPSAGPLPWKRFFEP